MPYKTTLPWRKFPRNTLHNPSLRFIIGRMEKENRQAVFTVFLALYCEADDDGFVDISDTDFFADQCLISADSLEIILQYFEKRRLIEKVAKDVPIYRIIDWLSPYPQSGGGKTAAERQKEYRERKKEEARTAEAAPTPETPSKTGTAAEAEKSETSTPPSEKITDEQQANAQTTSREAEEDAADEILSKDICALIEKYDNLTDSELITRIRLYKDARKNGAKREEAQRAAERCHSETDGAEKADGEPVIEAVCCSSTEDVEKPVVTLPKMEGITEHNALRNVTPPLHNEAVTLQPKIREEEEERERETDRNREVERERGKNRDGKTEKERVPERHKQKEKQNQEAGCVVQESTSKNDYDDEQHLEGRGGKEQETAGGQEKTSAVSWITALWESVSREGTDIQAVDEVKRAHAEVLLNGHFKKTGGLLYTVSEQERAALRFLSIFLFPLADDRNSIEVVMSQFVGVLNNFVKKGIFFGYEKCTARTLCSSYIFEPVFLKVERILQAKTGGGMRWDQCLLSCLKHLKAAEYAVMSIDSG